MPPGRPRIQEAGARRACLNHFGCPSFRPSPHARKASSLSPPATRPALSPTVMKFSSAALSATLVAFAGGAVAQLSILAPGGPDLWWSKSSELLAPL